MRVAVGEPADDWQLGLVTGNGRQGAVCWGPPERLRVTVSHERLFLPLGPPRDAPDTARLLPGLRRLLDEGRWAEAARAVAETAAADDPAYERTVWIDPLAGAATLTVRTSRPGPVRDFAASTDLATGMIEQRWRDAAGEVRVRVFASRPADAILVSLTATGGFTGSVHLGPIDGTPPVPVTARVTTDPGGLTLDVSFPAATWPGALTGYRVGCRVAGPAVPGPDGLILLGDAELTVRTRVGPGPDPVRPGGFEQRYAEHRAVHTELTGRVRLDVGDARIERLFAAGRHLIVSSTGELPPTLQGVWSGTWTPPWSSGYTLDGNLAAAVAALLPTGTPELLLPVFDLLDSVAGDLRHNARRLYGARGVLTPVHLSSHGRQNHFGPVWCQTFWTAGAGWLSRLYVDYWRYTGDREFLRERALPFLREAAAFTLDFVQVRDGVARFRPSYSPENAPASTGSQAAADATMDVAVTRDLLTGLLRVSRELGLDEPDEPRWRALLAALPPYRVADGLLAEWCHPGLTDRHEHRHASHLWPLWYEPDPLITGDPALRAAAAATVRRRLSWWAGAESGEMAYGLAQLGLAAAALGLAEEAYTALVLMAGRYWGRNLVPTHNRGEVFNVDLAGGFPAVVAAMLAGSAYGRLDLLPALPRAWPRGEVTGLLARDAVRVSRLSWAPGRAEAVLCARHDVRLTVTAPGAEPWTGELRGGEPLTLSFASLQNKSS